MMNRRATFKSMITLAFLFASLARAQRAPDVPFVVTPMPVVAAMLDLAALRPGERLIDLGSGDGRIVLEAARRGADATGVEIDAALVERARRRAELEGLQGRARFQRGDLFEAAIRDADVVTTYLLTRINARLRPKLLTELRPGARVVSHAFDMGDWTPDGQVIVDDKQVYLWIVPAVVGGAWRLTPARGPDRTVRFEQRYQRVSGEADGMPVEASLRGDRLFFRLDGAAYHGLVGDRTVTPDPAHADGAQGWRAERVD
jgi:SAM-dependent methyltransferase